MVGGTGFEPVTSTV